MARARIRHIESLDEVVAFVQADGGNHTVIFDVDNTLVRQGAPLDEFGQQVNAAIDRFEVTPGFSRVIVLTNGPERGVPRMISRGNKPWTSRRRLGLRGVGSPVVVVGDQILTDGLLAWRLKGTLLHLVVDGEDEPPRQALMRRLGGLVKAVVLRVDGGRPHNCAGRRTGR